jgi:phosphohistidine phosphatase
MAQCFGEEHAAMSELYLLRHAKAVPQGGAQSDADRPLEERGREGARLVAGWIKANKIAPALVLCSPATRTRQTLDLIADSFGAAPEIGYEPLLYLAGADKLLDRLHAIPDSVARVMMIGHNPGLQELAQNLSDTRIGPLADRLASDLATAGLVRFEVMSGWSGLRRHAARLVALVTPRDLA